MAPFDYFVVLAEMRTGSNFLETNLNAFDGLSCLGEAFNPHFIGYPNKPTLLGVTQTQRDADPDRVIAAIKGAPGLAGFRYFHDHDARVLDTLLADPRCAKIVLTRNPLDSYVSWKIAKATGQWKLTDVKRRKEAKAHFDAREFNNHVSALQQFQIKILNQLQTFGQTPFYIGYDDLHDLGVMNGLARWLGISAQLDTLDKSLKPQNPSPVTDKVLNLTEMQQALSDIDPFNLARTPNFEPRRGPAVPSYVAGITTPLLYLPVRGGPETQVTQWMADLDSVEMGALGRKMTQKHLRQWKRQMPGHRSFTVLRHPLARAHAVFCNRILNTGHGGYHQISDTLRRQFKLAIPASDTQGTYSRADHRAAFEGFLAFLKANLAGQTAIRVDADWGTQSQTLGGFGEFALPDHIFREEEMADALPQLAAHVGHSAPQQPKTGASDTPYALADIYDEALEAACMDVYQRDYMVFGFAPWRQAA
ncbi:MAG: sulfotransferase family 2 domain-containing protein [Sedimentitalea sp.]